jgi:predicted nucleotidyltransferase
LKILVEQFHPEQVILFGSYAYGQPTPDSDVDLLVVKPIHTSRVKDKVAIRRAWWPVMRKSAPLSFDLLLATPEEFNGDWWERGAFHMEIKSHGLKLA